MAWARSSLAVKIQAECLLSRMQGVTWMHLYGIRYSGILPLSLQELEISCCALNADRTPPWDAAQANSITRPDIDAMILIVIKCPVANSSSEP